MNSFFEFFSDDFASMYIFSCAGAVLLWMRLKADLRGANSLGEIFDHVFAGADKKAAIAKFLFFILFGGLVGIIFASPGTPAQAATAGIAWTRIAAKD